MKNPLAPKEPKGREKIEHYNAILIEELTSQFKFVTEHMMSIEERLTKKMDDKFGQVDSRFDMIEKTLELHSQKFVKIDIQLDKIEGRLGSVENRLGSVENRTDTIEHILLEFKRETNEHFEKLEQKIETHDHDIAQIKTVLHLS